MLIEYKGVGSGKHFKVLRCKDCNSMLKQFGRPKDEQLICKKCKRVYGYHEFGIKGEK